VDGQMLVLQEEMMMVAFVTPQHGKELPLMHIFVVVFFFVVNNLIKLVGKE
jgi:hypothetical protein